MKSNKKKSELHTADLVRDVAQTRSGRCVVGDGGRGGNAEGMVQSRHKKLHDGSTHKH